MARPIYVITDMDGELRAYDDHVEIERKGVMAKMSRGFSRKSKSIYYKNLAGIQVKRPGVHRGFIQFTLPGTIASARNVKEAGKDENSFLFMGHNYGVIKKIEQLILQKMNESPEAPVVGTSVADEVRELKKLMDEGLITKEQFIKKRDELLG